MMALAEGGEPAENAEVSNFPCQELTFSPTSSRMQLNELGNTVTVKTFAWMGCNLLHE